MRSANRLLAVALATAAVPACAADPGEGDDPVAPALEASAALPPEIQAVPDLPTAAVCNGGRWRCFARVRTATTGKPQLFLAGAGGLGPADLQDAYQIPAGGAGVTIAIVDAFHYASAAADLAVYRNAYGLPPCTVANGCFRVVNQYGQASPLPSAPPANNDWTMEAALDLDVASAACPACKIVLVEAEDDTSDGLFIAQNGAITAGATVISNSWGAPEYQGIATYEGYFNHPGVGIFVATGDAGYNDGGQGPDYPGTSAYVTGVGGTSLTPSSNARGWTESAWSSGGSACSLSIPKPSWQTSSPCAYKASSDVSAVGNPNTGVDVYHSRSGGWTVMGGTSAAAPIVAAIYAASGIGGASPSFAYQHASSYYDITSGSNGSCGSVLCRSQAGWDGPTGVGTPNAATFGSLPNNAPTAAITSPANGATVPPGFAIQSTASDDVGVTKVELRVDGNLVNTGTSPPYNFVAPGSLGDGSHSVEVRAYDSPGLTGTASISVTVRHTVQPDAAPAPDSNPGSPDGGVGGPDGGGGNPADDGTITGGCAAGGGGSGALALALAAAAVGLRRRRRG